MRIEIVCTGDEVLSGKTVNSNFSHISRRLEEVGLSVVWGTTVGDDRERLLEAFRLASGRADAVIVNGGLGPTVDDLSQEVAALAAGDTLALRPEWLDWMEQFYRRRNRPMPPNNRKQAMLPTTAELIDNPVGTACGFALDIGKARFFFTPGVPREMRRMLDEEIIPRLLAKVGGQAVIRLKRFHSYGIGESRVDHMLDGVLDLVPEGGVKLGFQTHFPQLETKLAARGATAEEVDAKLAPLIAEIRTRLGNFVIAEDDQSLEGVVLSALGAQGGTVAVAELLTGGAIAGRLSQADRTAAVFRRGLLATTPEALAAGLGGPAVAGTDTAAAEAAARAIRMASGTSHGLAVLVDHGGNLDKFDSDGGIALAIATADSVVSRQARLVGDRDRVRTGAVEMGLDCLRRHLLGLPVDERVDFERV
ncbi:MAG: CinA family nicotinamide mononucleotide deamidase-related protein [Alphaproteobacteria bacterium]